MSEGSFRARVAIAMVAAGGWLVISTEVLSAFGALSGLPILVAWTVFVGALGLSRGRLGLRLRRPASMPGILGWTMGLLFASTFAVGISTAPNTHDSMTYHLPRVMRWLDAGAVTVFETPIIRQVYQPPLAEFGIAHLVAVTGSDTLAFLVPWAALVGSAVVGSLIASERGVNKEGQVLAALLIVSIPMAAIQATTTKNDLVVTLWILIGLWIATTSRYQPWLRTVLFGVVVGLAVLSKGTAAVLLLPVGLIHVWRVVREDGVRAVGVGLVAVAVAVAFVGPHVSRMAEVVGSDLPLLLNETFTPTAAASNVLRTLALVAPFEPVVDLVVTAHEAAGLDVNEPTTTWPLTKFTPALDFGQDRAPAPLHLVLVVAAFVVGRDRRLGWVGLVAFVLLSAVFRWQPWHMRLILPIFAIWSIWAAVALPLQDRVMRLIGITVAAFALLALVVSPTRPLASIWTSDRDAEMFIARPEYGAAYRAAVESVPADCGRVRLVIVGGNTWEYPAWSMLGLGPLGDRQVVDTGHCAELVVYGNDVQVVVGQD